MKYNIEFEPIGRRGKYSSDQSILETARSLGIDIVNICGGISKCGKCKVQIIEGRVTEPTESEHKLLSKKELSAGYRLACAAFPLSDCKLRIPPESLSTLQRTQTEGTEIGIAPDPPVILYTVQTPIPSLEDLRSDANRIFEAIETQHRITAKKIDIEAIREMSPKLREDNFKANVFLREKEIIAVKSPEASLIGLAVDIGTTKIAVYLVDMRTGKTLASRGIMNPQISYGEDLISRIARVIKSPDNAALMQKLEVEAINEIIIEMCSEINIKQADIIEAVIAANTCIHHLFLKLPVSQLGKAPYVPAIQSAIDVKARDIGLALAPGAYIHCLPNIAGFIGGDHVAMLLATDLTREVGPTLALDIGTNTEICLASGGKMTSVSSPSGPAFEGAHIKHGMRASEGSIEHVRIEDNKIQYNTIGNKPPIGICGSGILDAVAELFRTGILDSNGRLGGHEKIRKDNEDTLEFLITEADKSKDIPEISITQKDIRQLQLAKGAISAGIELLLQKYKLSANEIEQVIIAGAFGTYIDIKSAVTIGMLPDISLERFIQVGNAAGTGAKIALISKSRRLEAQSIARKVGYLELATDPHFMDVFINSTRIGWNKKK